jgi:TPR repeat protein
MREIPSDNAEHKQKRRSVAILCGVVISVVLIVAAVNLGWIDAAGTSKPAVTPAPLASVAVQVSPVPKVEDVLPTNITDLTALASGGNALACLELGERYRAGRGCIRDEEEALRWYDKAAADDDTAVVLKLAKIFDTLGNRKRAEHNFEKAALRGVREAQLWMAYRHLKDETVEISDTYSWFNICAAWGDVASNASRDYMEKTYPDATITKGQVRARAIAITVEAYAIAKANPGDGTLQKRNALAGDVASQFSVAERYRSGVNGFEQDAVEAYAWYNVCAASGNQEAAAARDRLEFQMISTQKAAAQKRSRELLAQVEANKAKK